MNIVKKCQSCNRDFPVRRTRIKRSKYCSRACANAGKRTNRRGVLIGQVIALPIVGGTALLDVQDKDLQVIAWHSRTGYARGPVGGKLKVMHRIIVERKLGRRLAASEHVDHINHNPLDNRRYNLRVATASQNLANALPQKGRTSRYRGVSWNARDRRWVAYLTLERTVVRAGYFKSELEAAYVRDQFALVLHGEYAYLNVL